jgi:amidohydrolase
MNRLKQRIVDEIDRWRDDLIRIAQTIHANPELGFEEHQAAALLTDTLAAHGFQVERGVGGLPTAFVASADGRESRPAVAILAEYDALADLGHACGHNLIAASAVGAALGLRAVLPELAGSVQVIGTPAEETGGGKAILVEAGAFSGVDAAMMIHPATRNLIGRLSLTACPIKVAFHGQAAHAAGSPDKGVNALEAVLLTFSSINALRQHLRDDARIHGIITQGGVAANIVPDYAEARFLIRALEPSYADEVLDKVRACAEGAALATGARLVFGSDGPRYEARWPNPKLVALFSDNAAALGVEMEQATGNERMGSSDMGNVSQVVPAIHPYLAIAPEEVAGHSVEFRQASASPAGYNTMVLGAKALALTVVDLLAEPANLAEVRRAFQDQKQRHAI